MITGTGVQDQVDWAFTITGMRISAGAPLAGAFLGTRPPLLALGLRTRYFTLDDVWPIESPFHFLDSHMEDFAL
jgi:hypothetical protein